MSDKPVYFNEVVLGPFAPISDSFSDADKALLKSLYPHMDTCALISDSATLFDKILIVDYRGVARHLEGVPTAHMFTGDASTLMDALRAERATDSTWDITSGNHLVAAHGVSDAPTIQGMPNMLEVIQRGEAKINIWGLPD